MTPGNPRFPFQKQKNQTPFHIEHKPLPKRSSKFLNLGGDGPNLGRSERANTMPNTFGRNTKNFWGTTDDPQLDDIGLEERIEDYRKEDTDFAFDDWNTECKLPPSNL